MSRYITLSSDSDFPNNSISNFVSILDQPLRLIGDFEVALTDFQYMVDFECDLLKINLDLGMDRKIDVNVFEKVKKNYVSINQSLKDYNKLILFQTNVSRSNILFDKEFERLNESMTAFTIENQILEKLIIENRKEFDLYHFRNIDEDLNNVLNTLLSIKNVLDDEKSFIFRQSSIHLQINYLTNFRKYLEKFHDSINKSIKFSQIKLRKDVKINDRIEKNEVKDAIEKEFGQNVVLKNVSKGLEIIFDDLIQNCEIFSKNLFLIDKNKLLFKTGKSLEIIQNFYIHTDIISNECCGLENNRTLLKILKPEGNQFAYIHKSFDRPKYFKVDKTYINSINIKILDHNKKLINFKNGPILVTLHFRKK